VELVLQCLVISCDLGRILSYWLWQAKVIDVIFLNFSQPIGTSILLD